MSYSLVSEFSLLPLKFTSIFKKRSNSLLFSLSLLMLLYDTFTKLHCNFRNTGKSNKRTNKLQIDKT